jgi:hypothetical protein
MSLCAAVWVAALVGKEKQSFMSTTHNMLRVGFERRPLKEVV